VAEVGVTAATTVLTAGTFLITSSGLKIVQGINRTNQLKNLSKVNFALNSFGTAVNASNVYMKCRNVEAISKLNEANPDVVLRNNICPDPKITQLQDQDDTCALQGLMVIGNIATLGAGLGLFAKITSKRNGELQEFIDLVKKPGSQNRDLRFASSLTLEERIQVTESVLGRKLTPEQITALKKAHQLGPYDFDPNSALTREKDEILQAAGFSKRDSAIIRGNGIAGSFGSDESYLGRTVSVKRSDGSRSLAEIIGVAERDSAGNPIKYKVGWHTSEGYATRIARADETIIKYEPDDILYFKRSSGAYSKGRVLSSGADEEGRYYNMYWVENGFDMHKKVYLEEVSHISPDIQAAASKATEANRAARAAADAKEAAERAAAASAAEKNAREVAAKKVFMDQNKQLISEMQTMAKNNQRISSIDDIRRALNAPNATNDELKGLIRRLNSKFHPDRNPSALKEYADEASKALNEMSRVLKANEL
jgi:hypothetical protein